MSAAPFRNAAQEIVGAILVIQDLDREKRAEERFREFAAHSTNVLWIANTRDRTIEYLNPAFDKVFGAPTDRILRDRNLPVELIRPDDRTRALDAFERAALGEVAVEEFRIIRPDGGALDPQHLLSIHDELGQIRRAGGLAEDITRHEGRFVYVVDADEASRRNLSRLVRDGGYHVGAFSTSKAFLEAAPALLMSCLVLHLRHSEADGLEKAWPAATPRLHDLSRSRADVPSGESLRVCADGQV